ncbi:MAG: transglutaminase family protein [Pseudomonadota bacterium]
MRLTIHHQTQYKYEVAANYALQQMRLRPHSNAAQSILSWDVVLEGATQQTQFTDQHGNLVDLLELEPGRSEVTVTVSGEVETRNVNGVVGPHRLMMPLWFYQRETTLTKAGTGVSKLIDGLNPKDGEELTTLHELSQRIQTAITYQTGQTSTKTTAENALQHGAGVCQDHTHVFLAAARSLGLPARYVSGYLMMNDRVDQDASHAWAETHVDGLGWVGFDISNAISPDERYVQIAYGLDYRGAAPTRGFLVGAKHEDLAVSIQVQQ